MVAMSTSLAYRAFELDGIATVRSRKLTSMGNRPSFSGKRNFSGLDLEKQISPPVEGELFS